MSRIWNRDLSRRQLIGGAGGLLLSACAERTRGPFPPGATSCEKSFDIVFDSPAQSGFDQLVKRLIDVPSDELFALVTELLGQHSSDTMLAAVLTADVRTIMPYSGGDLHAAMSIWAARHFTIALDGELALVPVYYAARSLKFRAERSGYTLPDRVEPKDLGVSAALGAFDDAMSAWDPEAADSAVVNLLHNVDVTVATEHLGRWCCREMGDIGHASIWYGLGIRALDTLGWQFAEPVLRSIMRDNVRDPITGMPEFYDRHLDLLAAGAPILDPCGVDDGVTTELVQEIRLGDPEAASRLVLELLQSTAPAQSMWDGLALAGSEQLLRYGRGVALHRFDGMNALHHMYLRCEDPVTKALIIAQTATWMADFEMNPGDDILDYRVTPVESVDEVFDAVGRGPGPAASRAIGWFEGGGSLAEIVARAEVLAVQKAHVVDEHNYKFPVAVIEETRLASERWRPLIFAAIGGDTSRAPTTARDDWPPLEEVLEWVGQIG